MKRIRFGPAVRSLTLGVVTVAALSLAACQSDAPDNTSTSTVDDTSDHTEINASIDRLLGPHADFEQVIEELRRAVDASDTKAVASLVNYPLTVSLDGKQTAINDAGDFEQRYESIMTPALSKTIASQQYADLLVSQEGVEFGNGEVLVNGVCQDDACTQSRVRVVTLQPGG